MVYECERCGYSTQVLFNFERHKKRVRPCKQNNTSNGIINSKTTSNIDVNVNSNVNNDVNNDVNSNVSSHVNVNNDVNSNVSSHVNVSPNVNFVVNNESCKQICIKCKAHFVDKCALNIHMRKCNGLNKLQCEICERQFTTRSAKSRHKRYVKCQPVDIQDVNPQIINNDNTTNNTTNNNNITNTTNNNTTNNIQNNNDNKIIHQHIQINAFGKENYDYLLDENRRLKKIIEDRSVFMQKMIEAIHFDKEHPENHNIFMTNLQSKHIMIHDGKKFVKALKDPTFDKLLQDKRKIVNGNVEDLELTLGNEKYIKEKMSKLRFDDEIRKTLKDKLELMCYNNREMCNKELESSIEMIK